MGGEAQPRLPRVMATRGEEGESGVGEGGGRGGGVEAQPHLLRVLATS